MNVVMVYCTLSAFLCVLISCVYADKHKVLLLSFDGFRWDYVKHYATPNLDLFKQQGVSAPEGITNTFITKTFPSHYTMATGLHTESHGIINNFMYDPVFNSSFDYNTVEPRWWNGARPVWTAATLHGLKVGMYFWPGTGVELEGVRPYRWRAYEHNVVPKTGMDTAIDWLIEDDLDFVIAYFTEPDTAGHSYGAFSLKVGEEVRRMDELVGHLITKLTSANMYDSTDIVIVSDHGMTNVTADDEHVIVLSDFLDLEENILVMPDGGTLANILPRPGRENFVYQKLSGAHPHMTVRWKKDIPDRLNYKHHRRILPIVLFPDEGYFITKSRPYKFDVGQHGYDNQLPSMRPIFFARGPSFIPGFQIHSSYQSVNVYSLLCYLLGIQPSPNNGTLEASREMLRRNGRTASYSSTDNGGHPMLCTNILLFLFVASNILI